MPVIPPGPQPQLTRLGYVTDVSKLQSYVGNSNATVAARPRHLKLGAGRMSVRQPLVIAVPYTIIEAPGVVIDCQGGDTAIEIR